jgi:oxygen-independent coproporphyrinogen III oxidase
MLALSEKKYICKVMNADVVNPLLVRKYNRPLPRYTSYPTIPFWKEKLDIADWQKCFTEKFAEQNHVNGISLYIHLPFCETLCTYCGCNKKITTNHKVEEEYLEVIEKEWNLYRKLMKQVPVVREIHLGGGTPTFFSPKNLKRLLETIFKTSILHPKHEFSIEGHPNNTTLEHLTILHKLGFKRISYGVQDNDPEVQRIINRIQPLQNVKNATENARKVGFTSVNYDLIYGLPKQTLATIERTIKQIIELKPDRIAFYSYAHVPWTSKGQRLFDEKDLPAAEEKINLYLKGKQLLTEAGYFDIGMDHFALPHDELYKARLNGKLHRNFMGYTTQGSGMVLGLGVSAISDTGNAFAQNEKTLHDYYAAISKGVLAIKKGYELNEEDIAFKNYILNITCRSSTNFQAEHLATLKKYTFPNLQELTDDGLIEWDEKGLRLTDQGHYFIRVVCAAFDLHLLCQGYNEKQVFSKAI